MRIVLFSKRLLHTLAISVFTVFFAFHSHPTLVGAQGGDRSLRTEVAGVNAMADTTVDATLPDGFILSGMVQSADPFALFSASVVATSEDGSFSGGIQFGVGTYRIVLPAGSYSISIQQLSVDITNPEAGAPLFITTVVADALTITGDLTFNIMSPPPPERFSVSGVISSQGNLPTNGGITFASTDGRFRAFAELDSTYSLDLPAATYGVGVLPQIGPQDDPEQFLSLRVGAVTVSGPTMFNATLPPAATLSGTVQHASGAPVSDGFVFAFNPQDFPILGTNDDDVFVAVGTSGTDFIPEDSTTGAYSLLLPTGPYSVATGVDPDQDSETGDSLIYPFPPLELNLTTDLTQNFTIPELPPNVIISGRVTDASGQPVAGALVSADAQGIMNVPDSLYASDITETNGNGMYQLIVPRGPNYTVRFDPPTPFSPF